MAYLYHGILFSNKKEQRPNICCNMDEPQKHFAKGKKPDTDDCMLYKNWQIYKEISSCLGLGVRM